MDMNIAFADRPYCLEYQKLRYKGIGFHRNVLEILFVMRGELKITIEGEVSILKSGDFICINQGNSHMAEGDENTYTAALYIDLLHYQETFPFIPSIRFYGKYSSELTKDQDEYLAIRNYFIRLMQMDTVEIPMSKKLSIELCDIIINILMNHIYDEIYLRAKVSDMKPNDKERMLSISMFIHENFSRRGFSLSDLAAHEHLSPTRLSHFWKDITNMSFKDTVNAARFRMSKRLLMEGQLPISKIVEECGYSDEKYLYRTVKEKYGITPSEFRRIYREKMKRPEDCITIDANQINSLIIEYSYNCYVKINDLSFLIGRFDEVEEENLNELYTIITVANKQKKDGKKIDVDRSILKFGVDCGLRYSDGEFEINWEYTYAIVELGTKLLDNASVSIDGELMPVSKWLDILEQINYVFLEIWRKELEQELSLMITYKQHENMDTFRELAEEVCRLRYFPKAFSLMFL